MSEQPNNTSSIVCDQHLSTTEIESEPVENFVRFVLEGFVIPVIGLMGILGKVMVFS